MKGFIIHPTYKIENGKAYVYLFGMLENGESFLVKNYYRPYFYIKEADLRKAEKITEFDSEKTESKDFDRNRVAKIILDIPADVPKIRRQFEEEDITCYEADIRFAYRYMMDKNLLGSLSIKGDYKENETVKRVYEEADVQPTEYFPKLKILSIDIETDSHAEKLYSISLYTDDFKKVIFNKKTDKKLKNAIVASSEKEALEKFRELVLKLDPDIITGWNVIDFDIDFLKRKFQEHKIPFKIGRIDWECTVRIQADYFRDSKANIPGRVVLDGIQLLKTNFYKLEDYKLDTAAQTYLGEKKLIGGKNKGKEIEDAYKNEEQKLIDYNLKDAKLVYDILEKVGLISLTIRRSLITGMPLDRVQASIASLDSLYLRKLKERKYVAPSGKFTEREKRITGGYVMTSKPGIYNYVIVCDFKSLYPSIIRTFNIDPLMFTKEKRNTIEAPNGARFRREEGVLPELIQYLWIQRDKAKKMEDKAASYAIKIHMNSFFGVLASPNCRFYSYDMANAITTFGQKFIKLTAEKIKEQGHDVIYGDTDSIFVNLKINKQEESKTIGKKIQHYINNFLDNHIKKNYNRKSFLELEFEKVYTKFLMPYVRSGTSGAKKRYAGLVIDEKGKERMEFTGLEFVRRDWTELSKKFQLEMLNKIFHEQEIAEFVKGFIDNLREGKFDDLLIYKKALRKSVGDYIKTTPPHVKAARILETHGMLNSNIIEYVMTINGPEPVDRVSHSIDYEHYIKKQLRPLADSVLVFFDKKLDDILMNSQQASLFDF